MNKNIFTIKENRKIASGIMKMSLEGSGAEGMKPGQFVNILLPSRFLRRPISVCDINPDLSIIYKVVGKGTEDMSLMKPGQELDILTGLGNGYDLDCEIGEFPVLIGGGSGVPPLYYLAKELINAKKEVTVILGFNRAEDVYFEEEFKALGCKVRIATMDGSIGVKGLVTDALSEEIKDKNITYYFACGPSPMLRIVYESLDIDGQLSFESRMGCGFGACMGCSMETKNGYKRICKDGPVLKKEEIKPWID